MSTIKSTNRRSQPFLSSLLSVLGGSDLVALPVALGIAALLALCTVLSGTPQAMASMRHSPLSWSEEGSDLDTTLIHGGYLRALHFPETLRWWTGPWIGQVPFYRPLTS